MNAQTCTDHCPGCGQHFHGLGAFDRHLRRVNQRLNRCGAPDYDLEHVIGTEAGLQVWTEAGRCDLGPTRQEPVTIWQVAKTEAQAAWLAQRASERASDAPSAKTPRRRGPKTGPVDPDTHPPVSGRK